jgi:hypothetical protein
MEVQMPDRNLLRLSTTVLFAGVIVSMFSGFFHPDQVQANDHPAVFAEYAASHVWIAVHLGQFIGMAGIIAGLIAFPHALDAKSSRSGRLGAVAAIVALSLYGVLQAVDGVALKHAVDSWASAPELEKPARFAGAETIRWLEWAVRSYQSYMLGIAFILTGTMIVRTQKITMFIGYLMGVSGLAYLAQGWIIGSEGFSPANSLPTLLGIVSILVWSIWLVVTAWWQNQASASS